MWISEEALARQTFLGRISFCGRRGRAVVLASPESDAFKQKGLRQRETGKPIPKIDYAELNAFLDKVSAKWRFTVHKQVNKLKLAELVAASIAISVLVIH